MYMTAIDHAFRVNALQLDEELAGMTLRDAELDSIAHYFVYNADRYAAVYLETCPVG